LFVKIRQVIDFSIDYLYFLNKKKESEKIIILSGINVKKFIRENNLFAELDDEL